MKKILFLGAVLSAAYLTKPKMEDFDQFFKNFVKQKIGGDKSLLKDAFA